jgi:hypothetical protein
MTISSPNNTNFNSNIQFMLFILVIVLAAIVLIGVAFIFKYHKVFYALTKVDQKELSKEIRSRNLLKSEQGFSDTYGNDSNITSSNKGSITNSDQRPSFDEKPSDETTYMMNSSFT